MEPIKIAIGKQSATIEHDKVTLHFGNWEPDIMIPKPEAIQLAAALYAQFAEWKPISEKPEQTGLYHVKGNGWIYGFYYSHTNTWFALDEKTEISITHYTELLKPKP